MAVTSTIGHEETKRHLMHENTEENRLEPVPHSVHSNRVSTTAYEQTYEESLEQLEQTHKESLE